LSRRVFNQFRRGTQYEIRDESSIAEFG